MIKLVHPHHVRYYNNGSEYKIEYESGDKFGYILLKFCILYDFVFKSGIVCFFFN